MPTKLAAKLALIAAMLAPTAAAAVRDAPAAPVVERAPVLCPDSTNAIPVDAAGTLGCPGPAAVPGPFPYPPGTVPVDEPTPVDVTDPCFRQDPECYDE